MTGELFTGKFWRDAAERVAWTSAEVALPVFVGSSIFDVDYRAAAGITASAAVAALLKAILATRVGDPDSAATLPGELSGRRKAGTL